MTPSLRYQIARGQEGFFITEQTPSKVSPRVQWNFTYMPPSPVGQVELHSSTETSLIDARPTEPCISSCIKKVYSSWDRPVTLRCGVLGESGRQRLLPTQH